MKICDACISNNVTELNCDCDTCKELIRDNTPWGTIYHDNDCHCRQCVLAEITTIYFPFLPSRCNLCLQKNFTLILMLDLDICKRCIMNVVTV